MGHPCTRLSLYPFVTLVPNCPCTRLSHPCTRLSLYPFVTLVPVCPCTCLSHHLYPFVPVPNCRICTRLSLYPTVPVPNCPRTCLTWTRSFSYQMTLNRPI